MAAVALPLCNIPASGTSAVSMERLDVHAVAGLALPLQQYVSKLREDDAATVTLCLPPLQDIVRELLQL